MLGLKIWLFHPHDSTKTRNNDVVKEFPRVMENGGFPERIGAKLLR